MNEVKTGDPKRMATYRRRLKRNCEDEDDIHTDKKTTAVVEMVGGFSRRERIETGEPLFWVSVAGRWMDGGTEAVAEAEVEAMMMVEELEFQWWDSQPDKL
ncbi:hypothetical protein FEM48_Zijuj02G0128600 [Ziziphus jujuba var. spinosa]|uniref:Uncharacterized protein n=1 Tax=Ziziphus jujuba var. spinosa TaxID=714518 RepID=A0A978VVU4_ZIZJJ|nr:hypothetical protein FEM48_Zijuj02G0128600 [Ziziphus jujuba var. spinosa]